MMKEVVSTGTIIPLGDGLVGKTVIMNLLLDPDMDAKTVTSILVNTKKSKNIEMEFDSEKTEVDGIPVKASMQFYNFPGQIQKESARTITFNEILDIFEFLPALQDANVILLLYDVSRIYTLKSLENWIKVAVGKEWIGKDTLILLVSNKIDLQRPNDKFVAELKDGISKYLNKEGLENTNVDTISTSCKTKEGIKELQDIIVDWIARKGKKNASLEEIKMKYGY